MEAPLLEGGYLHKCKGQHDVLAIYQYALLSQSCHETRGSLQPYTKHRALQKDENFSLGYN